jgi:hypothetical protein
MAARERRLLYVYIRKGTIIAVTLLAVYGAFEGCCDIYARFIVPAVCKRREKKEVKAGEDE